MDAGLQILGRINDPDDDTINFSFLQPFTTRLWLIILFTLFLMTFALMFVEAPRFRHKFVYCKDQAEERSWQEKSMARSRPSPFRIDRARTHKE